MEPRQPNPAEKAGAIAFTITAFLVIAIHSVASLLMAASVVDSRIAGPAILIFDLPSFPLFVTLVYPLDLPKPLPYAAQAILSGLVWGLIVAVAVYIRAARRASHT
jgi:hypothetical protein